MREGFMEGNKGCETRALRWYIVKAKRRSVLSPLVAHLWVWLNMHQHLWICLNILENAWIQCSDYARALNVHDHFTCLKRFWRCLIMASYGSIMAEYAWIYLNVSQYAWTWAECCCMNLNMPENVWRNCSDCLLL